MMIFSVGIKLANVVAVQRLHDTNAREHRRPAMFGYEQKRRHRRLPFRGIVFRLGQFRDEFAGILQRDDLATARQRYWIIKRAFPTSAANGASPSCRIRF
jgi:hypothetical protein